MVELEAKQFVEDVTFSERAIPMTLKVVFCGVFFSLLFAQYKA